MKHHRDTNARVRLRKFPYPFRAMLAISSDIDCTDMALLVKQHQAIHAGENAIGLAFANSIWCFAAGADQGEQIAFFDMHSANPSQISDILLEKVRLGWFDTLHTYGNFSESRADGHRFERDFATKAIAYCKHHGIEFPVWVNHGDQFNTQNIGPTRFGYMKGDLQGHPAYHSDLLPELGVRFLAGHDDKATFSHSSMLRPFQLKDGQWIWSFARYIGDAIHSSRIKELCLSRECRVWGDKQAVWWHPQFLDLQLSERNLKSLIDQQGYSIVAQHLGYKGNNPKVFEHMMGCLRRLKSYEEKGLIKVVTTSSLLEYNRLNQFLKYTVDATPEHVHVNILAIEDPVSGVQKLESNDSSLRGVTFYAEQPHKLSMSVNGSLLPSSRLAVNPCDGEGCSVSIT